MTSRHYAFVLLLLMCLFTFRVVAQLVQAWYPVDFLPPYAVWHSGAIPYGILVIGQVVILGVCLRIVLRIFQNTITPVKRKGKILFALGILYLLGMGTRLIVGLTIAPDHYWFSATLPTVFHLVLASFVMLYGQFHVKNSQLSSPRYRDNPA